jgi:methionyl-tRNA formyltransferase
MKRIAFLGAKPIGAHCLRYLVDHQAELDAEVVAVLTRRPKGFAQSGVLELADERGLRVLKNLRQLRLLDEKIDILISVQHHQILKRKHIEKASQIAINLHMAPLPEYRGCNQFSWAIINGDDTFGTTLHVLDEGVDSGDILAERRFAIPANCFVKELYDLTVEHSKQLFEQSIAAIIAGEVEPKPQSELLGERACSFHLRKEIDELKRIDPAWPAEKIHRYFRATYMPGFEPPYMQLGETKVSLTLA